MNRIVVDALLNFKLAPRFGGIGRLVDVSRHRMAFQEDTAGTANNLTILTGSAVPSMRPSLEAIIPGSVPEIPAATCAGGFSAAAWRITR